MSWTVFPRIYTNLQSKVCFQFCFQVRRPNFNNSTPIYVILWEIRNHYWNIWFMKISKCQHFLFLKKQPQKWTHFSIFYLYITKLDIPMVCSILHLEIDFWNLSWKEIVSREKHYKWDIEENAIAYSTVRNLKTAYLGNFHFH